MIRESLDRYDVLPPAMINYLRYYGRHFNKKLCDFATKRMQSSEDDEKDSNKLKDADAKINHTALKIIGGHL